MVGVKELLLQDQWSQDDHKGKLPFVGVYATRDIKKDEEILADYGMGTFYEQEGIVQGFRVVSKDEEKEVEEGDEEEKEGEKKG